MRMYYFTKVKAVVTPKVTCVILPDPSPQPPFKGHLFYSKEFLTVP